MSPVDMAQISVTESTRVRLIVVTVSSFFIPDLLEPPPPPT
eukprot:CAMPEP_0182504530 /NCGR_PEP_ID=MMETSP1321-20130603/17391_1 /TAXON_ID=91990 /ORGANISM="Bolidomonas sp., Strain RCC1657" /LENGTH=40 /DNA_ID= /DNA_START= /DNA_END= /DNA_ORIENTATION=